jgi:DNA-binding winged helix-turn-helix (wHTH) protein/Tol biopolymer transport system component
MSAELTQKPAEIAFGEFRLDLPNGLLYRGSDEIKLPPRALAVLIYLVERANQVIGKQELMASIWKDVVVEEASLKEAISLLRQALGDDAQEPRYIQTVHRRGYRFVGIPPAESPARAARPRAWKLPAAVAVGLTLGVLLMLWLPRSLRLVNVKGGSESARALLTRLAQGGEAAPGMARFNVDVPAGYELALSPVSGVTASVVALAADGSEYAFVARHAGKDQLFVRAMDELTAKPIPGSDGAQEPFLSPDGRWVGFFADGEIKIAPVAGGSPTILCKVVDVDGASWGADDRIVFGGGGGISSVSIRGGEPVALTHADRAKSEISHMWPEALPDGSVVFTIFNASTPRPQIAIARHGQPGYEVLFEAANPHYLDDGHLLVMQAGNILSLPFDLTSGKITGTPNTVRSDVFTDLFMSVSQLAVSRGGAMILVQGPVLDTTAYLVWSDEAGKLTPLNVAGRPIANMALSPDGRSVAAGISYPDSYDVWVISLADATFQRLTQGGQNGHPIWSPDGKWVTYMSTDHPFAMMSTRPDGSETRALKLPKGEAYLLFPGSYSPDGKLLAITANKPSGADVALVSTAAEPSQTVYPHGGSIERYPHFSPDGRWLAYVSDAGESTPGRYQVYLRPYPGKGTYPVFRESGASGTQPDLKDYEDPFWSPDGRALYYQDGDDVMRIHLSFGSGVTGKAERLFQVHDLWLRGVSPDGKRLLFLKRAVLQKIPTQVEIDLPART